MNLKLSIWIPMGLGLVFLGACGSSSPSAVTVEPAKPAPEVPKPTPVKASEQSLRPVQSAPPSSAGQHRVNPRRLYQLDDLQKVKIKIDKHEFNCWVMDTESKRAEGMMFLQDQDFTEKDCMIFAFKEEQELSFWMQNTLVDLDIAYVNKSKGIITIKTMRALDETGVPSEGKALYAIEFKARLLKKLGIRPGMKVEIPSTVVPKE